jgi:hypothetical protein
VEQVHHFARSKFDHGARTAPETTVWAVPAAKISRQIQVALPRVHPLTRNARPFPPLVKPPLALNTPLSRELLPWLKEVPRRALGFLNSGFDLGFARSNPQ